MVISEQKDHREIDESDNDSIDSEEDPSFDILEETQTSLSKLSIKKRAKSRYSISEEMEEETEEGPELIVPELDKKDQKCYEGVQQIIQVGQIDKLKVDQCKLYLRKNGLRLTGNKDTLIGRIKEHLDIANGGGEKKYPTSSFIVNCKGDACTGDVVMFEQNVYEMFNIASRSANGPPCGTRIVAGRIVKESYGAAKQQHTFTIEVLWSKGEKPLPSLHPLLIKGRNLYKLKTMRQRWQDEGERQKILFEKHTRGSVARLNRDSRIQEKEMRNMLKAKRVKTDYQSQKMRENTSKTLPSLPIISGQPRRQPNEQQDLHPTVQFLAFNNLGKERSQPDMQKTSQVENVQQKEFWHSKVPSEAQYGGTSFFSNANVPPQRVCQAENVQQKEFWHSKAPSEAQYGGGTSFFSNANVPPQRVCQVENVQQKEFWHSKAPSEAQYGGGASFFSNANVPPQPVCQRQPLTTMNYNFCGYQQNFNSNLSRIPLKTLSQEQNMNSNQFGVQFRQESTIFNHLMKGPVRNHGESLFPRQMNEQKQLCRYYALGRCYHGDQCKYLHENGSYGQRKN